MSGDRLPMYLDAGTGAIYAVEVRDQQMREWSDGDERHTEIKPGLMVATPLGPNRRRHKAQTWVLIGDIDREELDR